MTQTAEIIWDRDHGTENEGYYVRLRRSDGQEEDNVLDSMTAAEAQSEVTRRYPAYEITHCDEVPGCE